MRAARQLSASHHSRFELSCHRPGPRTSLLLLILLALCNLSTPAHAKPSWAVAERKDKEIVEHVATLDELLLQSEVSAAQGAVFLETGILIQCTSMDHKITQNHILRILDDGLEEPANQDIVFGRDLKIEMAKGWLLRASGEIERLEKDAVRISQGKEDQAAEVILAFPRLRAGDTIGWSTRIKSKSWLFAKQFQLSEDYPLVIGQTVLKSNGRVAYSILARNVSRDRFGVKTKERKNGNPSHFVCTYKDLPARRNEPFARPWVKRESHLRVTLKGILDENLKHWIAIRSWNRVATFSERTLTRWVEPGKKTRAEAERVVAGLSTSQEKADAVYRFVRDELLLLGDEEGERELRSAADVLRDRNASSWEKGLLLTSMMRSAGIDAQYAFVRNRHYGKLDDQNPGLWQFSDIVVLLKDPSPRWYCPSVKGCPPGSLPPQLRGVRAMFTQTDLRDRDEKLWRQAYREMGNAIGPLVKRYLELVRSQDWCQFIRTAGDPLELAGMVQEEIDIDPRDGTATMQVEAQGSNFVTDLVLEDRDPVACTNGYLERRFSAGPQATAQSVKASYSDVEGRASLWSSVDIASLPPAASDSWILPAEVVFGEGPLHVWNGPDRGAFHVGTTRQYVYVCRLPLPVGWKGVERFPDLEIRNDRLVYQARADVLDGQIVLRRSLRLRAGTTPRSQLGQLDKDIRKILDFEQNALVLTNSEAEEE